MNVAKGKLKHVAVVFSLSIILAVILITLITLLNVTIVAVYVEGGLKIRYLILSEGDLKLNFNSSITGTPVTLHFKIARGEIKGYAIEANEAIVEYYSMGVLNVSEAVRKYRAESLFFCSTQKFEITVDGRELKLRDACVKIEVHSILKLPEKTFTRQ
ncbi:MAG: hypothetical protein P3X22_005070 [Thermoprotei archaeon]|nr:hypothetical protein [Thermoprotei archaeon]